jgi:hypothetical protein
MVSIIIRVALLAAFGFVIFKIIGLVFRFRAQPRSGVKCEGCRHCHLVDADGVMCRYGDTVTLKTYAHVKMCQDFSPN